MVRYLIRWSGLAAALGGILRAITSFTFVFPLGILHILYFVIDLLLFLGLMGVYGFQRKETGWIGLVGFLLAFPGTLLLLANDIGNGRVNLYAFAASFFAIGVSILAIGSWRASSLPRWVSAFLIVSTLIGICGYLFTGFGILFILSGVIFGIGFLGAGLTVWLQKAAISVAISERIQ